MRDRGLVNKTRVGRYAMRFIKTCLEALAVAAWMLLAASAAYGQYPVPLRYDLRISGPQLPAVPTTQEDPYKFGNYQTGNLALTGNLRYGKSFQGNVPYRQTGSQVSTDLPSLRLSNFRRDSFGVEDIGADEPYGGNIPYFPSSGRVTNVSNVGQQYETNQWGPLRPDYLPPSPTQAATGTETTTDASSGLVPPTTSQGVLSPSARQVMARGMNLPIETTTYVNLLIERSRAEDAARATQRGESEGEEDTSDETDYTMTYGETSAATTALTPIPGLSLFAEDEEAPPPPTSRSRKSSTVSRQRPGRSRVASDETSSALPSDAEDDHPAGVVLAPPTPYAPLRSLETYLKAGDKALRERRYGYAAGMYATALTLDRNRPEAVFGRTHALLVAGRYSEVDFLLTRALADHPEWARSLPDLTKVYSQDDAVDRIIEDLTAAIERQPESPKYQFVMGYVLDAAGRPAEAKPHLEQAATLRGKDVKGPESSLLDAINASPKAEEKKE